MSQQARELTQKAVEALVAGSAEEALDWAGQATVAAPDYADAWIQVGIASSTLGRNLQAEDAFRKALELSPYGSKARYNYAVHKYQLGEYGAAKILAEEALRLDPNHPASRELLAQLGSSQPEPPATEATSSNDYYQSWQAPQETVPVQPVDKAPGVLPWIDRMGTGWWAIALFLGIANFAGFVISRQIMPNSDPQNMDDAFKIALEATKHPQWPLAMLLQLGSLAGITLFGLLDIVHRRGNFLWLAPLFLCTCFSLGFLILPMYVLSVRTKEKLSR